MKCGDCGIGVTELNHHHYGRQSICDECWQNRGWLIENRERIDEKTFLAIQRSLAARRGTARKKIETLKRELS